MLSSQQNGRRNDDEEDIIKNDVNVELEYLKHRVVDIQQQQEDDDEDVILPTPYAGNVNSLQQLHEIPDEYLNITKVCAVISK